MTRPTAARAKDMLAQSMTEAELQSAVIEMADALGWLVHHCRSARRKDGTWSTPISGDKGFPDLVLAHRTHGILWVELKSERGKITNDQSQWRATLHLGGARTFLWRPRHWLSGEIECELRGQGG